MRGILSYGAAAAKIRAMEGKLLTDRDYKKLASLSTVAEAADFLRSFPAYADIFRGLDPASLHRGTIEQQLTGSLYMDFSRLYRFCSIKQRKFLDLYFLHFEIDLLKKCLRNATARQPEPLGLHLFEEFLEKHSEAPFSRLSGAASLDEFLTLLRGTVYEAVTEPLREAGEDSPFLYETALDLFYFKRAFQSLKNSGEHKRLSAVLKTFGTTIDLLNLQWIYRGKRYYAMDPDALKPLLIPIACRIKKSRLESLIRAGSEEEFFSLLAPTWYGKALTKAGLTEPLDLEALSRFILNRAHRKEEKKNPYSPASLDSYLYFKEEELKQIVTIIECIRYGVKYERKGDAF